MEIMRGHREGSRRRKMDALGRGTEGERQGRHTRSGGGLQRRRQGQGRRGRERK